MRLMEIDLKFEHDGQSYQLTVECPAVVIARCVRVKDASAETVPRDVLTAAPVWPHIRNALAALRRAFPGGVV